jgi:ABC-2 type transport system ATP-binding protein
MLELQEVTKNFSNHKAVDRISLQTGQGEIFGFLGPNGAGKTTTIKMIAGLLQPTSGNILIDGQDLQHRARESKAKTGYIPDRPYLYEKLTGFEYLSFVASLYQDTRKHWGQRAERYLDLFDLMIWKNRLIEGYSHGMRQKLIMTSIFMLNQPLIVVDEPMVGLDPKSAKVVKELFKAKARQGCTIFLSTHSMEIAEELCDRIAIILDGRLEATGTCEELRRQSATVSTSLEEIFLQLTGAYELQSVISALRDEASPPHGT